MHLRASAAKAMVFVVGIVGCRADRPDASSGARPAQAPAAAAPTGPLQPADFLVAGVADDGDSAAVIAVLGRPDSIEIRPHPWDTTGLRIWHYRNAGLEVQLAQGIERIAIVNSAAATARGVRVGEPVERVRAAYGERHGGGAGQWRYDDDGDPSGLHGIEFRVRGDSVIGIVLGWLGHGNEPPPWDWARPAWVVSGAGIGPITAHTSEQDLVRLLGPDHVARDSIHIGEGESVLGTILFRGDRRRQLVVLWDDAEQRTPREIQVEGTMWRTREGIGLGTDLRTIEELNGRPFTLSGWGWDYGGQVCSFEAGSLDAALRGVSLRLGGDQRALTEAEREEILGEACRPSSLEPVRRMAPTVVAMRVRLR